MEQKRVKFHEHRGELPRAIQFKAKGKYYDFVGELIVKIRKLGEGRFVQMTFDDDAGGRSEARKIQHSTVSRGRKDGGGRLKSTLVSDGGVLKLSISVR